MSSYDKQIIDHLAFLYGEERAPSLSKRLLALLDRFHQDHPELHQKAGEDRLSERDTILIAYGDYYFRQKQNMLEAMPMAIQCYILAAHICGPRGQKVPKRGKVQPQTYNSLLDKWDAFSNAMVELELVFPYSNQTPFPIGVSNGVIGLANVFGFATTLYFCIPD